MRRFSSFSTSGQGCVAKKGVRKILVSNISTKHIDKVKTEHMHFLRCSEEDLSDLVSSRGLVPAGKWVRKKWLTELSGVLGDKGG